MLIPFKRYLFISNFPKEIVVDKLISITDNKKFIRTTNTTKIFEGNVDENSFEINRILNYRNSFYPIISGNFIAQSKESTFIKIKMRMTVFSIIFMSIWFLITGAIFIAVLSEQLQSNKLELNSIFMSLIFILFGYLLMIIGFNYEVKKAEKILNEVL